MVLFDYKVYLCKSIFSKQNIGAKVINISWKIKVMTNNMKACKMVEQYQMIKVQ